jgi:hypothetical protein
MSSLITVPLADLRPNPWRDFTVDPIDGNHLQQLVTSIRECGFWGGVIVRRNDKGQLEIAHGHHRAMAALEAGVETSDVLLVEVSDEAEMVRWLYRGHEPLRSCTYKTNAIAQGFRQVAKLLLEDRLADLFEGKPLAPRQLQQHQDALSSPKGLSYKVVERWVKVST